MSQELQEESEIVWAAYNHMPGGQIVVARFENYTLKRKMGGDKVEEVFFSAVSQAEGLRKSPFVALCINGKVEQNKILLYTDGYKIRKTRNAADVVIEWAKAKGMVPILSAAEKKQVVHQDTRIDEAEKRIQSLEQKVEDSNSKLDQVLKLLLEGKK